MSRADRSQRPRRSKHPHLLTFLVLVAAASLGVSADTSAGTPRTVVAQYTVRSQAEAPAVDAVQTPRAVGRAAVAAHVGSPPDPLEPGSPPPPEMRAHEVTGRAALARIGYPWRTELPGWTIDFHSHHPTLRGITRFGERRIDVYVHTDDVFELAAVVAHELGHAVDVTINDTGARRRWKAARGIGAAVAWWPTPGRADFDTGSGDFAECFAAWQLGAPSRSAYGDCRSSDLDLLAELIG